MEIAVREAAERLGISVPRVRQLLMSGDLAGRRLGRVWLVSAESVARMRERGARLPGRPLGPRRAWALLDLLAGGDAASLAPSARSQVRVRARGLAGATPGQWRAALRGRSEVLPCLAHPAAVSRLVGLAGVLPAGLAALRSRPFDLAVAEHAIDQAYVDPARWPALSAALAIRPTGQDHPSAAPNLTVFLPQVAWPFWGCKELPDSVLAADLLDSAEPRAARAGVQRLGELLEEHLL
ncbi:MAG: helix-turn-helix domain-containing protein [Trebonia sp.]